MGDGEVAFLILLLAGSFLETVVVGGGVVVVVVVEVEVDDEVDDEVDEDCEVLGAGQSGNRIFRASDEKNLQSLASPTHKNTYTLSPM